MFIKARKFFSRKNKKALYNKYIHDYIDFKTLCERYEKKLYSLNIAIKNIAIKDNVNKNYIYEYLLNVRDEVTGLSREAICYTYQDLFDGIDIVFTPKDYCNLMFKTQKMTVALGKMEAALDLLDHLKLKKLTIRRI